MPADDASEIMIRAAGPQDVSQLMELIDPFVRQRKLLARSEHEVRKLVEDGFAAEAAGRIVGFAAIEVYSRKLAELQCLAVAENFHGRGIGRRLIDCCIQRARECQVYELMAITSSEEVWKTCGFDYSLPDQKRAMFIHTGPPPDDSQD